LNERILVMDDAKNIRMMISKCLTLEGYEVETVDNGYDGINCIRESYYDVVILDIRMPELSGTEVLKIIKGLSNDVNVIIVTAFPTIKNAVDCIKMGALDYLRKPFTPDKIKGYVKSIIDRKYVTDLDTDNYEQALQYAKKCIKTENYDEGIKYLKKSISISIEDAEPFNLLGNVFELKDDINSAEKYYRIALQLEPGSQTIIESLNRIENRNLKNS